MRSGTNYSTLPIILQLAKSILQLTESPALNIAFASNKVYSDHFLFRFV